MTGPEHYREAERLLTEAGDVYAADELDGPAAVALTARAQVHATLALVSAQAASTQSAMAAMFTAAPRWRGVATGTEDSG